MLHIAKRSENREREREREKEEEDCGDTQRGEEEGRSKKSRTGTESHLTSVDQQEVSCETWL